MLLRGRWHHCEVSTAACQGSLCPFLNFHPMWNLSTFLQQHIPLLTSSPRAHVGIIKLVARTRARRREGLKVHCRLWHISPHCCSLSAGNLPSRADIEKNNSFPPRAGVFEARQPASKAADGAALKRGLTWAHGQEEWHGRHPVPASSCPSALSHQQFKNTNIGCLEKLFCLFKLWNGKCFTAEFTLYHTFWRHKEE